MTTIAERNQCPQVLLIEDNQGDAVLIRMAFKKAKMPCGVLVADTAEAGLDILRREEDYRDTPHPDVVLLDLNLPKMHGLAFLRILKSDPDLSSLPVIVLSSSSAETDIVASYAAHANGFITKPLILDDYDDVVAGIKAYWFGLMQTPSPVNPSPQMQSRPI